MTSKVFICKLCRRKYKHRKSVANCWYRHYVNNDTYLIEWFKTDDGKKWLENHKN